MGTNPVPAGFEGYLVPYLVVDDAAAAVEFYAAAFGAVEESRAALPDGRIVNAQLRIGPQPLWVTDDMADGQQGAARSPKALGDTPAAFHRFVPDVDAAVERAVGAGAELRVPPTDMFWGDRYAALIDPFGHEWTFASRIAEVSEAEVDEGLGR